MSYATDQGILNAQWNAAELACIAAEKQAKPHVLMRPKIYMDGDSWCALYGENIQDGVCGFGDSPEKAALSFDKKWIGIDKINSE